ncbi:MAG: hypothetical protein A2Z20_12885 [Bdellovibrionales bacterium RBG_16_40_8]|nr:MAG: hypothetical protein A2Z20_12885 [Bdellovibrionales bacterium RBG_16_40_8]
MKRYFLLLGSFLIVACTNSTESSWMVSPKPVYQTYTETGGTLSFDFTPKAEILFVVDNSASMRKHIDKVSTSIDQFVDAFSSHNPLEYNLAVVSVFDNRTYSKKEYLDKWSGTENYFQLGQFRQVKKSETEIVANKYFISSRDENLKDLLRNTLKIGVQDLKSGGPQIEESFSPLAALYELSELKLDNFFQARQKNFFMGKDSYKIIFFVTDAAEASQVTPSDLFYGLVAKSGGDRTKVLSFGAIVPSNVNNCARDPGGKPYALEEFLSLTRKSYEGSNIVSLCESFGAKFAAFGKSIRARVMNKIIHLENAIPIISDNAVETLRVFYGNQEILLETNSDIIGFEYDPLINAIRINPRLELSQQPGAKLRIQYTSARAK